MQTDWVQGWHGAWRRASVTSTEVPAIDQVEIDCFKTAFKGIVNRGLHHVDLLELGCGWGEWCLALAGMVKTGNTGITSYRAIGIEGEPMYAEIAREHLRYNQVNGWVLNCAVSDHEGVCRFNRFTGKSSYYCQGMTGGNFGGSRLKTGLLAAYHLLRGKTVEVPMTTVDELVKTYALRNLIVHCDVQGVEDRVIRSAVYSLDHINYWIVGTHSRELNHVVKDLLSIKYDCQVDIEPFKKLNGIKQDGLQFYTRKGI